MAEIRERETMSKTLSKYIAVLEYFYKTMLVLSATRGSTFVPAFGAVMGAPVETTNANFSLFFSSSNGIIKNVLKTAGKRKRNTGRLFYQLEVN